LPELCAVSMPTALQTLSEVRNLLKNNGFLISLRMLWRPVGSCHRALGSHFRIRLAN